MAKEAKDRQSELKRLVEQPQSAFSKPEKLPEQISGVQGASQTDLHKAFGHAQDMLKDHIPQYEAAIDSLVKAAKHELNDSKAEQGWGGEHGGPGTEEMRKKIVKAVKQRWVLEKMMKSVEKAVGSAGSHTAD